MTSQLKWTCCPFSQLSLEQLYQIIQLRERVFVVEQDCVYLDCDGFDQKAQHIFAELDHQVVAYLRVLPAGIRFPQASYGRVVTAPEVRGTGTGKLLNQKALEFARSQFPGETLKISAQSYLEKFYGELGFKPTGNTYLEDDMPHMEMTLQL